MKIISVDEKWCLGCHLCEYHCILSSLGGGDIVSKLRGKPFLPRVRVEEGDQVSYAVSCRHCRKPLCVRGCIAGALTKREDGMVDIDRSKCVGCHTCVLVCPYGAIQPDESGHAMQKCRLCVDSATGIPACVAGCPNNAIRLTEEES